LPSTFELHTASKSLHIYFSFWQSGP